MLLASLVRGRERGRGRVRGRVRVRGRGRVKVRGRARVRVSLTRLVLTFILLPRMSLWLHKHVAGFNSFQSHFLCFPHS